MRLHWVLHIGLHHLHELMHDHWIKLSVVSGRLLVSYHVLLHHTVAKPLLLRILVLDPLMIRSLTIILNHLRIKGSPVLLHLRPLRRIQFA